MFKYRQQLNTTDIPAKLPKTRKQQLWDILKNDFSLIVNISLLCLLLSVPLLVVLAIEYMLITNVTNVTFNNVFPVVFYCGIASIPLWGIRYVARSSAFAVMKKRVFNEGAFVAETFWRNVKENFGTKFLCGVIVGVSCLISAIGTVYFGFVTGNSFAQGFGIGVSILQYAIVYVSAEYYLAQNNLYILRFADAFGNGIKLTFAKFLFTVVYFGIFVLLPLILVSLSVWGAVAVVSVVCIMLDGISVLVMTLYAFRQFDNYINKEHYPQYVNKGLFDDKEINNG